MRRGRTAGEIVDDLTDVVDPSTWAAIDSARIRTGGSWSDVKSIRVRQADDVLDDKDFTVIEVTVKRGEVYGVRVLQRGVYSYVLQRGPFLFWGLEDFVLWFSDEMHLGEGVQHLKQVWVRGQWAGTQASLAELHEVFTS